MRWMHLRLRAPLGAFGGEMIDARGVTRNFPAQSMMTGLLANALGWTRTMRDEHQSLQERIVFGALWEQEVGLSRMTDYQTAQLGKNDRAWTTRGVPAGRAGGAATYAGSHQRWRDYHADLRVTVVLRLEPADESPTLEDLAAALDRPSRPLFIGRKSSTRASMVVPAQRGTGLFGAAVEARVGSESCVGRRDRTDGRALLAGA